MDANIIADGICLAIFRIGMTVGLVFALYIGVVILRDSMQKRKARNVARRAERAPEKPMDFRSFIGMGR